MSFDARFAAYEQAYDTTVIPNVPIVVRASIRNYNNIIKNLEKPFPADVLDILSNAMYTSVMEIDSAVFALHSNAEVFFILSGNGSLFYNNRVQKICSIVSSLMSINFMKYFLASDDPPNIVGEAVFETSVFAVSSYSEVVNLLTMKQRECFGNAVSSIADIELPDNMNYGSVSDKVETLQSYAGFNMDDLPHFLKYGSAAYKVPKVIEIGESKLTKNKWTLDKSIPDFTKNSEWVLSILKNGKF